MAKGLSAKEVGRLARIGAAARLAELQAEISALRRAFPGLKAAPVSAGVPDLSAAPKPARKARRRRAMTAAEKKAVSDRMKKYWADRKKGKAKA